MQVTATTEDSYQLLHRGSLVLADVSANGIRIDEALLQHNIDRVGRQIRHQQKTLEQDSVWKEWRKRFDTKASLGSRDQLGKILTDLYPKVWKADDFTKTGRLKTDDDTLDRVDLPFIQNYVKWQKLHKARSTYLQGIQRETANGLIHPVFSLALVRTYRGSSDSPNFQNMPIRVPWMSELIRTCFLASPDHFLIEIDIKGNEVGVSACYNHDPKLLAYVRDTSLDMHRDMAAEIYKCSLEQVTKNTRYCAKNKFVFPQFYGDWYLSCAKNLWESIRKMKLDLVDGTPMLEHLKAQGIRKLGACDPEEDPRPGTFERHLKDVEHRFWYDRFAVYQEWKNEWYAEYQKRGWFRMLTGFICQGYMTRKEVINYPVQGSAFHCLLWGLIKLHEYIKRHNMKTRIVGQIHDSILADVPKDEREQFIRAARRIMTELLPRQWPWIIVPVVIEIEASPLGGSWFDKAKVET